jgi:hypothetical protein
MSSLATTSSPSETVGKGTSGFIREAESTDALERGGLLRSSYEAGVMLAERVLAAIDGVNQQPVVHTWSYRLDEAA